MASVLEAREIALYDDWKRNGRHWEEYASELAGTAFLMLCVVGLVALFFSDLSPLPHWVLSLPLRLLFLGVCIGTASALVAVSPPGRLSGAHLNPAISAGFWLLGKMHRRDFAGYVVSQMAGGVLGTLLGVAVFGASAKSVRMGSLHPGPQVSLWEAWVGEFFGTFVLALAVYVFVGVPALMRWTPAMAAVLLGFLLAVDGSYSGAGFNPARWLGPALAAGFWHDGTAYAAAPMLAGVAAAGLRRFFGQGPLLHTAKLFHDARYRSIFKDDAAPSRPPADLRQ